MRRKSSREETKIKTIEHSEEQYVSWTRPEREEIDRADMQHEDMFLHRFKEPTTKAEVKSLHDKQHRNTYAV